jgi:hypothetical protein
MLTVTEGSNGAADTLAATISKVKILEVFICWDSEKIM